MNKENAFWKVMSYLFILIFLPVIIIFVLQEKKKGDEQ